MNEVVGPGIESLFVRGILEFDQTYTENGCQTNVLHDLVGEKLGDYPRHFLVGCTQYASTKNENHQRCFEYDLALDLECFGLFPSLNLNLLNWHLAFLKKFRLWLQNKKFPLEFGLKCLWQLGYKFFELLVV
jgi:hypothetical protein